MGYNTKYLGSLRIEPPLNAVELEWMNAFLEWSGGPDGDVFAVPMNPRAAWSEAFSAAQDRTGSGLIGISRPEHIPLSLFDWRPSIQGTHLYWEEMERSNDAKQALGFWVEHFLGPTARARESGHTVFEGFTFDHTLTGTVAGLREDSGELFLLHVRDSEIRHEVISPGVYPWEAEGPVVDEGETGNTDDAWVVPERRT